MSELLLIILVGIFILKPKDFYQLGKFFKQIPLYWQLFLNQKQAQGVDESYQDD